ncbi:hypothetical protein AK812_SmicGene3980 [Symbiodinium microadriaticum]|uniref:Uncharacterized protein n=1 Tax=Symbiodinium microadriaticum TaxID=2951 RepID=A0A1Q9EXS4_SYMMI|nr:hypothetical protein AK812_SmicGene3980 [Symbiodinium microadriaticum]
MTRLKWFSTKCATALGRRKESKVWDSRSLREALPARDNDAVGAALNQLAADIDSLGALALGIAAGPVQSDCRGEALSGSTRKVVDVRWANGDVKQHNRASS